MIDELWIDGHHASHFRLYRFSFLPLGFLARTQTKLLVQCHSAKIWKHAIYLNTEVDATGTMQQAFVLYFPSTYTITVAVQTLGDVGVAPSGVLLTDINRSIRSVVDEYYSFLFDDVFDFVPCRHCMLDVTTASQCSEIDILTTIATTDLPFANRFISARNSTSCVFISKEGERITCSLNNSTSHTPNQ